MSSLASSSSRSALLPVEGADFPGRHQQPQLGGNRGPTRIQYGVPENAPLPRTPEPDGASGGGAPLLPLLAQPSAASATMPSRGPLVPRTLRGEEANILVSTGFRDSRATAAAATAAAANAQARFGSVPGHPLVQSDREPVRMPC